MATHSSILAWEMPRREEPEGRSPWVVLKLGSTQQLRTQPAAGPFVLPRLSQALWLWLRSLRRPAVSLGVGAPVDRASLASVGLGTGQVPGKLGAQVSLRLGPQEVQRPLGRGGWEAAGAEDRHLRGRAGLSSEWDPGEAPLSQRGRAPRARTHARPPGQWGSWKPSGPGPGQALAGLVLAVFGGGPASAGRSPVAGLAAQVQHAPRREPEGARSRLISEAKQGRAWLGSWMGDHLGIPGARGFLPTRRGPLAPAARPDSWIPPAAPAPPGPRERLAGAPTPAADLGHPTTGSPVSIWGSFGLPQAIPGLARTPARAPAPAPPPASQAIAHAHVRTHAQIDVPKRGIYLFLREPPYSFPYRLYPCPFLLTVEESSLCSTSSPALVIDRHRSEAQSDSCEVASLVVPSGGVWLLQKCEDLPSSSDFGVICNHPESFQSVANGVDSRNTCCSPALPLILLLHTQCSGQGLDCPLGLIILAWEMPRREEPEGRSPWVVLKLGSTQQLRTQVFPKTTLNQPPARSSGPRLSQALWLWLRSLRRPAVSLGVGRSRAWRGVKGGASVVRRGGAEALRSTAPPWLLLGLGTGQVPGKLGAQVSLRLGPQEVQRPLGRGGWEAAGAEDRHLRGRAGLSSEWDPGEAPLSQRGRPPGPARTHARTPSRSMGAPGRPSGPRARPGACWSGIGGVRGAGRRQQAGVRSRVLRLKYSTPPDERCGPLARPAGQSEREAKPKALRAPRANRLRLRPYQPEGARSRLISEAKQGRAWLGSWMGDHLGIPAPAPPGPRGAAGRGPDSRCRPGLPPRGPRAPPHSHSASRTPDDRQQSRACTDSSQSPSPPPPPASQAIAHAHVRTHAQIDVPKRGIYLFLREPPYSFPYRLYPCPFLLTVEESSLCSTSSPALVIDRHRSEAQSDSCEVVPPWSLELSLSNH
ncbi:unnamed protein product [Ceratitis capitata]|uniref:(Mediterranean fruit fly) hypothetical protein n=1 Tax=Ceratitis capitata TaxID=7213 RepID=A0A811VMP9_CERCA|nr:unnamed protein product [Ceratitis capitata]